MPVIQTYSDTEFAHLTAKLAKVTAERDRARDIAVALEQEVAEVREQVAQEIERRRDEHEADDKAEGCRSRFCAGWLLGQTHAAHLARGGAA